MHSLKSMTCALVIWLPNKTRTIYQLKVEGVYEIVELNYTDIVCNIYISEMNLNLFSLFFYLHVYFVEEMGEHTARENDILFC